MKVIIEIYAANVNKSIETEHNEIGRLTSLALQKELVDWGEYTMTFLKFMTNCSILFLTFGIILLIMLGSLIILMVVLILIGKTIYIDCLLIFSFFFL